MLKLGWLSFFFFAGRLKTFNSLLITLTSGQIEGTTRSEGERTLSSQTSMLFSRVRVSSYGDVFLRFSYAVRYLSVLLSICSMLLDVIVFVSKRTALRAFQIECLATVYKKTSRSVCDITFGGKINWIQSSKDGFK